MLTQPLGMVQCAKGCAISSHEVDVRTDHDTEKTAMGPRDKAPGTQDRALDRVVFLM